MSQTLRYIRQLLGEVGARVSPEPLPAPVLPVVHGELRPPDQGTVESTPRPFSFFLAAAARAFLLGEIPRADGPPIPISLLSLSAGVISRSGTGLAPFMRPVFGQVICLPLSVGQAVEVDRYRGVGITPLFAGDPATPRHAMLEAQRLAMAEMVEDTKESVFLAWHDAAGGAGHHILVDGSLHPTHSVLTKGSWIGIRNALGTHPTETLTPLEEQAALGLPAGAASLPFGFELSGGYWFTRTAPAPRADSAEGLLRLETAFVDDEHVASKVTAFTRAIAHDRYPVVPAEGEGVPLYPLRRARAYLETYITSPQAVVQAL
ncbi:MAG TPA: hypothetical protein VEI97_02845 [bacterium]|nr:hypothetical protein [bacterium]